MPVPDFNKLFNSMITAATNTAAASWQQISGVATHEFQTIAHRIVQIGGAFAAGQIDKIDAQGLMKLAKNHVVAVIATLTTLVLAAVQRIVNAALAAIRDAVNAAIGFVLV